jgi:hypothetical protein
MAVKVIVPNKQYSDVFMGVRFENGVGIFEDEKVAREIADFFGYEIEELEPKKKSPARKAPAKKAPAKDSEE